MKAMKLYPADTAALATEDLKKGGYGSRRR